MAILAKLIYRFNAIPFKVIADLFAEIDKADPKIYMEIWDPE